jgi:hypothetical protein
MTYKNIPKNAEIISIKETEFTHNYYNMTGLIIETTKGTIKIGISDNQSCCERYGSEFLETPDDINKFIGSEILSISDTNKSYLECNKNTEAEETQLKIKTNKGVLQYAVYNDHNGYYSHATFVQIFDKNFESGI